MKKVPGEIEVAWDATCFWETERKRWGDPLGNFFIEPYQSAKLTSLFFSCPFIAFVQDFYHEFLLTIEKNITISCAYAQIGASS